MSQHKTNPTAIAARLGQIAPKAKPAEKPIRVDLRDLKPQQRTFKSASQKRRIAFREWTRIMNWLGLRYKAKHAKLALLPPQDGHRRAEFSSPVVGEWAPK